MITLLNLKYLKTLHKVKGWVVEIHKNRCCLGLALVTQVLGDILQVTLKMAKNVGKWPKWWIFDGCFGVFG